MTSPEISSENQLESHADSVENQWYDHSSMSRGLTGSNIQKFNQDKMPKLCHVFLSFPMLPLKFVCIYL